LFSPHTLVSSTNKTDHHDITEILLKVALNTITLTLHFIFRNNLDKRAVNELTYQCQEYKTLMQVADVEKEKLAELVQVLQKR
jgi:membrane-bound inhibitor of C-type lysozyme